ncbi:cation-translocating P-type ATPase [Malacoplasma iowae]|uniref:cation-translocating P-type ATPase n=1 Tax=Malacoplasma iowae TaxID=2116 RepID=UPI002A18CF8C|nr:cation-translocating P-type ATPase [Malacoplasma iowae]WPL40288.1 cation-translocating P-type ATPase [Malacoplasma iowae]
MNKNLSEAQSKLTSDFEKGLTSQEVAKRIKTFGYNKLKEKKQHTFFRKFINQFYDPLLLLLIVAAIISYVVAGLNSRKQHFEPIEVIVEWVEPSVILLIVFINALFGAIQEAKAEKAMEALNKMTTPITKVIRDGNFDQISSIEVVPGDIVIIEAGDTIPADGIIIENNSLKVIESVLTGESIAIEKNEDFVYDDKTPIGDRLNYVYSGTSVINGRATILVTNTGMNTEIGKIASLLNENDGGLSPLEKRISSLGKKLTYIAMFFLVLVFILYVTYVNDPSLISETWSNGFKVAVSIAISVIPEGLLAILTVILALGVKRMAKQNALIKKLSSVETLGSASVICSDKTGTLTQNKMTIVEVFTNKKSFKEFDSKEVKQLIEYGMLCNDTKIDENELIGDPTETSIVKAGIDNGIEVNSLLKKYPRVEELPFDSDRKLMSTIHKVSDGYLVVTKGAVDNLFSICKNKESIKEYEKQNEIMSNKALRVLGIAIKKIKSIPKDVTFKTIEKDLQLIGLLGIIDPPREEVKLSIQECLKAGIRPIMITGDHANTASAIAKELNILYSDEQKTITGSELEKMSDEELQQHIKEYSVYARVSPQDKIRVVKAWQKNGDIVAMTGDGVNDAPALQAADIGCAMGITGTEVSKGAADMILVDDNFSTIVEAVKEGRGVLDNIKRMMLTLFTTNVSELFTLLFGMLIFRFNPFSALQILWINLVTESFPGIALGMKKAERDVMSFKPNYSNNLLDKKMVLKVLSQGLLTFALCTVGFFLGAGMFVNFNFSLIVQSLQAFHKTTGTSREILLNMQMAGSTMVFITLSISQAFNAFNMFSKHNICTYKWDDIKYVFYAFGISTFFILLVLLVPKMNEVFNLNPYVFSDVKTITQITTSENITTVVQSSTSINYSYFIIIAFVFAFVQTIIIELLKIINNSNWYRKIVNKSNFLKKWN